MGAPGGARTERVEAEAGVGRALLAQLEVEVLGVRRHRREVRPGVDEPLVAYTRVVGPFSLAQFSFTWRITTWSGNGAEWLGRPRLARPFATAAAMAL